MDQRHDLALTAARLADAEATRSVRRLQHAWGHYAEAGDIAAMRDLFTEDAELILPPHHVKGRPAIDRVLTEVFSPIRGRFDLRMMLSPVITVAGDLARARWHELALSTREDDEGVWSGGIQENVYRKEGGRWRIAELRHHALFAGSHLAGWRNLTPTTPEIPIHFTPEQAGRIAPDAAAHGVETDSSAHLTDRAVAAVDESRVINLVNAFAFYMDRKSWDDVTDLFAADAVVAWRGRTASGRQQIRSLFDEFGPVGLREGEIFDHLHMMPIVTFSEDGESADVRTLELSIITTHGESTTWSYSVSDAQASRIDGRWQLTAMRTVKRAGADHFHSWEDTRSAEDGNHQSAQINFPHPTEPVPARPARPVEPTLTERALSQAAAFDAAENVSCAYGYFLDDARWSESAALFAADGWKELSFIGTYIGRERILGSLVSRYGTAPRKADFLPIHQKLQPYVTVSDDGSRAQVRLKLFQVNSGWDRPASIVTGVYENQVTREDGVWRIHGMDLEYVTLTSWSDGWVHTPADAARMFAPSPEAIAAFSPAPDSRLRGQTYAPYPRVAALGFHYCNPVSGRAPALFLDWSDGRFDPEAAT